MGTTAETADIKSGSLLRMGDVSTLHSSGTQITIHISANSTALLRPLRFLHSKGAVALSRAHMADLETCQRSTVVESVSCNVTGLTSFYSPHGTAEGSTPRERQYDRNAEQTQERNQEFLQYPTDQSRDMLHQGFVGSHHPYSEPIMENTSGTMTEEVAQAPATLVSVATDVQQQAGEGSSCRQRSKIVSQASSEPLRNSPMTPEYRRRASLNETAPVLGAKAYERLSPTRLFSTHHPSRELQVRSESSGQRGGRANQQPVLPQEEVSPSKTSAHNASSVPRCLHSNREWASEGQPWPHQGHATAPVQTNPAELTAIHGVRLRPISPSKATENSLTAKDLVISALCDQIQHQQWKLKVQENRLHNQEQRLHELEAFVSSFQAQQEWKQRHQQHMCHLLSRSRGCHPFPNVEVINDLASGSSGIPRVTTNPSFIGSQWPTGIVDSSPAHAERQGVCSAPADHQWLRSNIDQAQGDAGADDCREGTRKKSPFCCF